MPAPRMASAGIGSRWGDWCSEVGWLYEVGLLGWDWRRVVRSGREEAEEGETQTSPTFTQYGAVGSATCAEILVCCGLIVFGFMWWGMEVGV